MAMSVLYPSMLSVERMLLSQKCYISPVVALMVTGGVRAAKASDPDREGTHARDAWDEETPRRLEFANFVIG